MDEAATAGWTRRGTMAAAGAVGAALTFRRVKAATGGDIALLRRAYTELHPGLLRYQTPEQAAARFDALERAFGEAPALRSRFLVLSRALAAVRCGHTYANFYNQRKATRAALFEGRDRLPFLFLWLGDRMVVSADPAGVGIAPGTEVLAIDGRPAREILTALLPYARADGRNDAKRRRLMGVQAEDGYETFDVFFPLVFGSRDRYRLLLRGPDGRTREQTVDALSLETRRAQRKADVASDGPVWTWEARGRTAVLTMPSWALYDSKWDWRAWLAARFEAAARTRVSGLVVDLRGNEGGQDCGDEIVARLVDAPVFTRDWRRLIRFRETPADLRPALDTWDPSFQTWGKDARPFDARFLELPREDDDAVKPAGPRFRGRVAVLIDAQNSSATYQFAATVRRLKLGVLVGEETGGNLRGINGGAFFFLRLPESGLEADLPIVGAFPRGPTPPDRGVAPDVAVPRTAQDIAAGRDAALARALEIVRA